MKHLFIARHGNYNDKDRLSESGHIQMDMLGEVIKQILIVLQNTS